MKYTPMVFTILVFLMFSLFNLFPSVSSEEGPPTRATVYYSGSVDGVGQDGDICLAGHRWYNISFSFLELAPEEITSLGVSIKTGGQVSPLLTWDLETTGVIQEMLQGQLSLRRPGYYYDGINTTFHFDAWFHLSWEYERQLTFLPRLWINRTSQVIDALSELQIGVHGTLQPMGMEIVDSSGAEVNEDATVKANTTISIKGLGFVYWHLTEDLSTYHPSSSELEPVIQSGDQIWNLSFVQDGFTAEITVPDIKSGRFTISIDLPGMHDDWKVKVNQWEYGLDIDGMAPTISLRRPGPLTKEGDVNFEWEMTVTDLPKLSDLEVDGSSIEYRIFRNGVWESWIGVTPVENGKSLTFIGTATGEKGSNKTFLQFKASDVLGNLNISNPFSIMINEPPVVEVPQGLEGSTHFDNETLSLSGSMFIEDPDDLPKDLDYTWYLDNDTRPISTLEIFNKTLFNLLPGEHSITLVVSDGYSSDEASFTFIVEKAPKPDDGTDPTHILTDPIFLTIAIPILLMILIIIIVVIIIVISKKMRKADDFIINEDSTMDNSQAEDMARRIREMYNEAAAAQASGDDARLESDDGKFDFDYNLYEILKLEPDATDVEIKKAYRKFAAYHHPDRVAMNKEIDPAEAAEEMLRINKAKEVLMNPEFKAEYDSYISDLDFSMDLNDDEVDDDEDWN